eukprot:4497122-Pyramimonas_sp.AAC.1
MGSRIVPVKLHAGQHFVQQLTASTDKWLSYNVFLRKMGAPGLSRYEAYSQSMRSSTSKSEQNLPQLQGPLQQ